MAKFNPNEFYEKHVTTKEVDILTALAHLTDAQIKEFFDYCRSTYTIYNRNGKLKCK